MRRQTRLDHEERIEAAIRYIVENLDEPIDLRDLADHVCLSRFHFHRVFQALVGETVGEVVRRLRLERAANHLRTTDTPITELAFEAGYATHEAFIRAFRAAFGCTPTTMRRRLPHDGQLPTPNGVHYGRRPRIRFVAPQGEIAMQVEIRQLEPRKAVCMTHHGPYFLIGHTFSQLGAWLKETGIDAGPALGIYYDDPEVTPAAELRSEAGVFIAIAHGDLCADQGAGPMRVDGGRASVALSASDAAFGKSAPDSFRGRLFWQGVSEFAGVCI